MIDLETATVHRARLSDLDYQPQSTEGESELIRAIMHACRTEAHAAKVVGNWLTTAKKCPKPSEIYELANRMAADYDERRAEHWCSFCNGTGFRRAWLLKTGSGVELISEKRYVELLNGGLPKTNGGIGLQELYTAVRRCMECTLGRQRADAARMDGRN